MYVCELYNNNNFNQSIVGVACMQQYDKLIITIDHFHVYRRTEENSRLLLLNLIIDPSHDESCLFVLGVA